MTITMTKAEYKKKYGIAPVIPGVSKVDTTPAPPAPVTMTRAEYNAKYGVQSTAQNTAQDKPNFFENFRDTLNTINPIYQVPKMVIEGGKKFAEGIGNLALNSKTQGDVLKNTLSAGAGAVQAGVSIPLGFFESVTNLPGIKQIKDFLWSSNKGSIPSWAADKISEIKPLQKLVQENPNIPEMTDDAAMIILGLLGNKKVNSPEFSNEMLKVKAKVIEPTVKKIDTKVNEIKTNRDVATTKNISNEIANIENNYAKLRQNNEYSKNADASRLRIAQTDVLVNAVDTEGTIRTKQPGGAVDQYRKLTIDGYEDTVKKNLVRLNEQVNLQQVYRELALEVNRSGLEGADLLTALNGIKKEIAGLSLKADQSGNIPLSLVHDAKINTTRNINYNTPPETATYRKAVARGYKTLVENNSKFNVKAVNEELSKYYEDINRLEALDGRKVKGGKLGKYFAQISGNIIGGVAGAATGGIVGSAIGTIVGGEAGGYIKGKTMGKTFGKERGLGSKVNPILENAKAQSELPPTVDLTKPSPIVGAGKGIPKTKEIYQIEKEIRKNVEQQKTAIRKGDFTLVEKLKEIYDALVSKLKEIIQRIKTTPNKEGGFARIPLGETKKGITPEKISKNMSFEDKEIANKFIKLDNPEVAKQAEPMLKAMGIDNLFRPEQVRFLKEAIDYSNNLGNLNKQYSKTNTANMTGISSTIPQKTTIGKTALGEKIMETGEQKPTIKLKRDVQVTTLQGEKVKIPEDEVLKAYESGGKMLLKDGREYIVSKSQYENIKNNSLKSEAKEFAPELKGTEETVKGDVLAPTFDSIKWTGGKDNMVGKLNNREFMIKKERDGWYVAEKDGLLGRRAINYTDAVETLNRYLKEQAPKTKYSNYQLPGGKNYKEVLIKAPTRENSPYWLENKKTGEVRSFDNADLARKEMMRQEVKTDFQIRPQSAAIDFKSSHWDEPNVISHLRLNERTYKGKKVTLMEELQSDWAREARKQSDYLKKQYPNSPDFIANQEAKSPTHPLLKNWQELSVKRALKEAVDNNSDYLAWTTGEQQVARYNLSTQIDYIKWNEPLAFENSPAFKNIAIQGKEGKSFATTIDKNGKILTSSNSNWHDKNLSDVIGKGISEKILAEPKGNLSGEGLNIGGEWAKNLYDKQVKNIVEDLTGHKVEVIDMGLGTGEKVNEFYPSATKIKENATPLKPSELKVGMQVLKVARGEGSHGNYIITDILKDGKFKAVPKNIYNGTIGEGTSVEGNVYRTKELKLYDIKNHTETFDISTKKSAGQQAIKITPEIKALVKGEAPKLK